MEEGALLAELARRATQAAQGWRPGAVVSDVRPLTGGLSSLTFVASVSGVAEREATTVLKVAPPGLPPVRNRDVLRQGKVLRALSAKDGLVPPLYFADAGRPPEVPPFIAMGFVPGECSEPVLSEERSPERLPLVRSRALDAARVLAEIHALPPAAIGLGDEPVVGLAEEIDRWTRAFEAVPPDLSGDYERTAAVLHDTVPAAVRPVVNHGDYRLGNTLCQGGRLQAVIDWEIWSVGDPRIDLSWLAFFTDEARHPASPSDEPTGVPPPAELVAAYEGAGGQRFGDLGWFDALTYYKEAAATALLIKQHRRRGPLPPPVARMVGALPRLLDDAIGLLSREDAAEAAPGISRCGGRRR